MRCKNCGANYRTAELRCPYCETENLVGKFWLVRRTETIKNLERDMKAAKQRYVPYVASKLLSKMIFIVLVAIIVLAFVDSKSGESLLSSKDYMKRLHDAGKYYDLYRYMDKKDNFTSAPEYLTQSSLMAMEYNNFLTYRMSYLPDDANNWEADYVSMVMSKAMHIYTHEIGTYNKEHPENAKQYELYNTRILAFWKGTMMCDDSEVAWLADPESQWHSAELKQLCDKIKARRIAAYGK